LKAMNQYNAIDLRPEAIAEAEEKKRKKEQAAQERRERLERERLEKEKSQNEEPGAVRLEAGELSGDIL
jgi:hypothetical protein